ncbi:rod shape-determining protein MreB [Aquimarina sp. M1]
MGFFDFLNNKIAVDLGTTNTLITHKGKIAIDAPSIIAINRISGNIIAVGKEANSMRGKIHENIKTLSPLKNGVIANFDLSEKMLKIFIKKLSEVGNAIFIKSFKIIIAIPCGITKVEMRAVKDSARRLNAKQVYLISEPMAAAIGAGIDVLQPKGHMVIDIGGGTTEIAVITLGGIISGKSVKIAGNVFNKDIIKYLREYHNLHIGERTAEEIKINIGSALDTLTSPPKKVAVRGRDILTGKPKQVHITFKEIAKSLDKSIRQIENAVLDTLSDIPPEVSSDIYKTGIFLTGGGSMLRGLDIRFSMATDLPVYKGENPLQMVVKGSDMVLKNLDRYTHVLINNI